MRRALFGLALAAPLTNPTIAVAQTDGAKLEQVLLLGAAYIRCPKGTVSEKNMAMGVMVFQREANMTPDQAFEFVTQAAQRVAETIKTDAELEALCKTFAGSCQNSTPSGFFLIPDA